MFRYIVRIRFKEIYKCTKCEINCRHIVFNNIGIELYKSDFNVIKCFNLNDIESIEVKPYVYHIRQQ